MGLIREKQGFIDDGSGSITLEDITDLLVFNEGVQIDGNEVKADFNATNLKLSSNKIDTIQDIALASTPTFKGLNLLGGLAGGLVVRGTSGAATGSNSALSSFRDDKTTIDAAVNWVNSIKRQDSTVDALLFGNDGNDNAVIAVNAGVLRIGEQNGTVFSEIICIERDGLADHILRLENADADTTLVVRSTAATSRVIVRVDRKDIASDGIIEFMTDGVLDAQIGLDNNPAFGVGMLSIKNNNDDDVPLIVDTVSHRVGINSSSAPTESLDVTGNIAVSGNVDSRDIAADGIVLDQLEADSVTPAIEDLTIGSNGQTIFTIADTPKSSLNDSILVLNGAVYFQALGDFGVSGTTLTWNDPGGLTLLTTDTLVYRYNSPAITSNIKEIQLAGADYNSNFNGTVRSRSIAGSGNFDFTFKIPDDLNTLLSVDIKFGVTGGVAGSGKDIDLISNYAFDGEAYNQNSESDLATVYDFTGLTDNYSSYSLMPVLQNVLAGHNVAVNIDHNGIGGTLNYTSIVIKYT